MAFFGLIIASMVLVHLVRASTSAESKPTCKEYPASRDNGTKSQGSVMDSAITELNDTDLERASRTLARKTKESFASRAKTPPAKRSERAMGTRMTVIISVPGKARNERQTESYILMSYCLVTSCLLLEVLICVVLQLSLQKKCSQTGPETQDAENTSPIFSNFIYQPGLQHPCISEPLPTTRQGPYQPLVVNTSELGMSGEYRALEGGHRDDHRDGVPVDNTDYQDLDPTKPRDKYKSLLVVGSFSEDIECNKANRHYDEPNLQEISKETDAKASTSAAESSSVFHSLLSLARSAGSRVRGWRTSSSPSKHSPTRASQFDQSAKGPLHHTLHLEVTTEKEPGGPERNNCNVPRETEDQKHHVIEELETTVNTRALNGNHAEEPLYYVLEGPFPSPESKRDPMHCVVKELESLNENGPKRASSDDSTAEPLYYVLENLEDSEGKNSKEETKP